VYLEHSQGLLGCVSNPVCHVITFINGRVTPIVRLTISKTVSSLLLALVVASLNKETMAITNHFIQLTTLQALELSYYLMSDSIESEFMLTHKVVC
jgi:hypothetical protein